MKNQLNQSKAITLIALVITIIVLLILAGVTIVTLTGDNGLLQKAQSAGEQSKIAEAEEQIKLIYAEYQISKYAEGNTSAGDYLKEQLEKTYGEGNVDIISSEETIVLKVTDNGEIKFYEYNPSTGISKELQKGINYNGKKATEIQPGDDITIVTEKFKVFAVADGKIKAMPYNNLKLDSNPIRQATNNEAAGSIAFSTSVYWEKDEDAIDMNNSANNIKQYIIDYKITLEKLNVEGITVRIAKYSELNVSGITSKMKNPGQKSAFWLGSANSYLDTTNFVWYVYSNGTLSSGYRFNYPNGVRPIIEIPIE